MSGACAFEGCKNECDPLVQVGAQGKVAIEFSLCPDHVKEFGTYPASWYSWYFGTVMMGAAFQKSMPVFRKDYLVPTPKKEEEKKE